MKQIQGQISWVYTRELETSAAFYRDILQLKISRDAGTAIIFETAPRAFLGVCEAFEDRIVEPKGGMTTILVETTQQVDDWYRRLQDTCADLKGPPETLEKFGIYSFFCKDPNGYLIEIQTFLE